MLGILQFILKYSELHIKVNYWAYKLQKQTSNFITLQNTFWEQNLTYGIGLNSCNDITWINLFIERVVSTIIFLWVYACRESSSFSHRMPQPNAGNWAGSRKNEILIFWLLLDDE